KKRGSRVDQEEVAASFRRTIAQLGTRAKPKRRARREDGVEEFVEPSRTIEVNEFMSVAELAHKMAVSPTEVVAKCLELGMLATVNQRLDLDTIETIALEFDFSIKQVEEIGEEMLAETPIDETKLQPRPPVVTVMGHVDHGKTSLLDYIRRANVVAGEKGGITQHIGAYTVETNRGRVTFLDTPGHQAFTAMRARGAQATDIVILVVAADDAVMPQTIEAIDHAKAAGVQIIVAINKIDLPGADPERVKSQLSEHGLIPEEWGGKTVMVPVSAKKGTNVDQLLEMVLLQAELLELKADPDRHARGVVIEAQLDRGRGPVATVLVQQGTLRIGDFFVTGAHYGRVRTMLDERGKPVREAGPSTPVQVTGCSGVPQAGDTFVVSEDEQQVREISHARERLKREQQHHLIAKASLSNLYDRIKEGAIQELKIVIKGDVDGSVEVLADTLSKIKSEEISVNVIHRGVGAITESDVLLAAASDAVIIGFHVRPDTRTRDLAKSEGVDVRLYDIIYEAESDIRRALEGMLAPIEVEERTAEVKVKETFKVSKVGTVAGCEVIEGTVHNKDSVRVVRDGVTIYTGVIGTLRRFQDEVKEVGAGLECGIKIENFNDVKVGDVFEFFRVTKQERKL
ncbi:MAG TPA: translation initiation factor IF-2, partial [bacterium]|nr:translation initiation factor IF-2 [bacterium]